MHLVSGMEASCVSMGCADGLLHLHWLRSTAVSADALFETSFTSQIALNCDLIALLLLIVCMVSGGSLCSM